MRSPDYAVASGRLEHAERVGQGVQRGAEARCRYRAGPRARAGSPRPGRRRRPAATSPSTSGVGNSAIGPTPPDRRSCSARLGPTARRGANASVRRIADPRRQRRGGRRRRTDTPACQCSSPSSPAAVKPTVCAARSAVAVSGPAVSGRCSPPAVMPGTSPDSAARRVVTAASPRRRSGPHVAARVVQQVSERVGNERAVGLGDAGTRVQQRGEQAGRAASGRSAASFGGQRAEQGLRLGQQRLRVRVPRSPASAASTTSSDPVGAESRHLRSEIRRGG